MRGPPSSWYRALGLLLALLALAPLPASGRDVAALLEAGFAVVDLTPEGRVALGGRATMLGRTARAAHDPIQASAVALRDGAASAAIVSVDLAGVSAEAHARVAQRVGDLGLDLLVLTATGTRTGPGGLSEAPLWRPSMGRHDPRTAERMIDGVARAVRAAHADLSPARVALSHAPIEGLQQPVDESPGAASPSLGVLHVTDPEGRTRGLLVHVAAQPVLARAGESLLSADWPGALRGALEERFPGATAIVLQGAAADVAPRTPRGEAGDPWARMEAYGRRLAQVAHAALGAGAASAEAHEAHGLLVHGTGVAWGLTVAGRLLGRDEPSALAPAGALPIPVARLDLGPLEIATVPGEATAAVGRLLGEGATRWVITHAQDHLGVFHDRTAFRRGGAESDLALFGPAGADLLLAAAGRAEHPEPHARDPGPPPPPSRQASPGASDPLVLHPETRGARNAAHGLGLAHGRALAGAIHDLLAAAEEGVGAQAMDRGMGLPLLPLSLRMGVPARDLVMPLLVRGARRLQPHLLAEHLDEMEGVAEGAGVPYDAILLQNVLLTLVEQPKPWAVLDLGFHCTNVVALGEATSMGQVLHGSTLDWGLAEVLRPRTLSLVLVPTEGHPFVSVTWPGMVGTLRAMGAQGLAVTEESCAAPDDTTTEGMPLPLLLRQVVQHAGDLDEAIALLRETPGTAGYKITVSDGRRLDARVVERTARRMNVRRPEEGILPGRDPDAPDDLYEGVRDAKVPATDAKAARRYPVVRARLDPLRSRIRLGDVKAALAQVEGKVLGTDTILAAVFEPQMLRFHVALGEDVRPGEGRLDWRSHVLQDLVPGARLAPYLPPLPFPTGVEAERLSQHALPGGRRIERVRLRSPLPSGHPANDVFVADLWLPPDPRGVVIALPAWKERGHALQRAAALWLSGEGFAVLVLPLPYGEGRGVGGRGIGEWTLSHDLARTRQAMVQAVADVAAASFWLEAEHGFGPERQGLMGTSLGGHVAALALGAHGERFAAAALLLTGSDITAAFLQENSITGRIHRELLRREVGLAEALDLVGVLDPARRADPARQGDVILVAGTQDDAVPVSSVRALAEAYGGARILWYEGDHRGLARHLPILAEAIPAHFDGRFGARLPDPPDAGEDPGR